MISAGSAGSQRCIEMSVVILLTFSRYLKPEEQKFELNANTEKDISRREINIVEVSLVINTCNTAYTSIEEARG